MVYIMAGNRSGEQMSEAQYDVQCFAFVISSVVCVLLFAFFAFSYFGKLGGQSQIVLDERINPNSAPAASLVRLGGIGPGRAEAIIAYRRRFAETAAGPAFTNCLDLQKISGIGPKTVENICQWLEFE